MGNELCAMFRVACVVCRAGVPCCAAGVSVIASLWQQCCVVGHAPLCSMLLTWMQNLRCACSMWLLGVIARCC
eukprot:9550349-Alexandrium_andersonii.AAC.1